jgi:hypothetical protein
MYSKLLIFLSLPYTWYPQLDLFNSRVNVISAMHKISGHSESPWNIPVFISMDLDCINPLSVSSCSCVLYFSTDNLQNSPILLYSPISSIDFSMQLCRTLSNAFVVIVIIIINIMQHRHVSYRGLSPLPLPEADIRPDPEPVQTNLYPYTIAMLP